MPSCPGGRLVTSSLDVAVRFEKAHYTVLEAIDALLVQAPACASNFGATSETVAMPRGGTREVRSYDMDRDGFSLLVMGFTGSKAIKFKLAYIAEFNEMEAVVLKVGDANCSRSAAIHRPGERFHGLKGLGDFLTTTTHLSVFLR